MAEGGGSSAHLAVSLVWDGSRGYMSSGGLHMTLWERPQPYGVAPFAEVLYRPRAGDLRILRRGKWADLGAGERYAIDSWLQRWASGARESAKAWDGKTERRQGDRRAGAQVAALLAPVTTTPQPAGNAP